MNKYSMTCTCGHEMTVDAESKEQAVEQLKSMMTEEAIASHCAEKHPGEPVPSKEESDANIEQNTKQA
ncbi:MAG TPA: hypothetical protein VGA53_00150 [Candidatus Paceibacterota bacterium]